MKKILSLASLLFLCFYLPAQQVILEKIDKDVTYKDILVRDDGYYVLGAIEREFMTDGRIDQTYTSFVAKLDAQFNTVYERKFPEAEFISFHEMVGTDDGIWLIGTQHGAPGSEVSKGWVHKMGFDGTELYDRKFAHAGFHSTEGAKIRLLRSGDLLLDFMLYQNFGSMGHSRLYRITPDGREVWSKDIEPQKAYCVVNDILETSDGSLFLTGSVYETRADLVNEQGKGWMYRMDGENPGRVFLNEQLTFAPNLCLGPAIELDDGGMWVVAVARKVFDSWSVFMELNPDGKVLRTQEYRFEKGLQMQHMIYEAETDKILLAGISRSQSSSNAYCHLMRIDPGSLVATHQTYNEGRFNRMILFDNGELLMQSRMRLELLR